MKAYQVFARMTPERTHELLEQLRQRAPAVYTQALAAASAVGVKHEEGGLAEDAPAEPERAVLERALASFRKDDDAADRALLLEAFAAQSSIDWPVLEELIGAPRPS